MTAFTSARAWGGFVLVFASFVACGCDGEKPSGKVAGKVTYKGNPVTAGDVNFRSKSGAAAIGTIDATGQYKLDGQLEAGEYQVFATPPLPEPQAPGTKAATVATSVSSRHRIAPRGVGISPKPTADRCAGRSTPG